MACLNLIYKLLRIHTGFIWRRINLQISVPFIIKVIVISLRFVPTFEKYYIKLASCKQGFLEYFYLWLMFSYWTTQTCYRLVHCYPSDFGFQMPPVFLQWEWPVLMRMSKGHHQHLSILLAPLPPHPLIPHLALLSPPLHHPLLSYWHQSAPSLRRLFHRSLRRNLIQIRRTLGLVFWYTWVNEWLRTLHVM